jgi:hypothetical protein
MFIRVLYCIFLGLLVALFVGWAMESWFPIPQWNTVYPDYEQFSNEPPVPTTAELNLLSEADKAQRIQQFDNDRAKYIEWQQNHEERDMAFQKMVERQGTAVSVISLVIAVIVTSFSLLYSGNLFVISEGLLLGGIFTLIYSIGWTLTHAPKIAVLTVGVSLLVTLAVGFIKFAKKRPHKEPLAPEPPKLMWIVKGPSGPNDTENSQVIYTVYKSE